MLRWKLLLGLAVCVGLAFAGIYLLANAAKTLNAPAAAPVITLYPQTPAPTPPPQDGTLPPPTPSPLPATPTPALKKYTVQPGDTMLDIALKNGLSLETLSAANPGINPVLLQIGAVLSIPAPGQAAQAPAPAQRAHEITADAEVSSNEAVQQNGGLNLRNQPGFDTTIVGQLPVFTPVKIIGRSEDAAWAQIKTDDAKTGWVFVLYLDLNGKLEWGKVAVTSQKTAAVPIAQKPAAAASAPANGTGKAASTGPTSYPYLSIGSRVKAIYQNGQKLGNRANAFSLIGDSNTDNPAFFKPFSWGAYTLGSYSYLQPTIDYFKPSFGRVSQSAFGGWNTSAVLDPSKAPGGCGGQTPLACEYSQNKPSVAIILLGTGDQHTWQGFEVRYRQIIEFTISQGVIPVLLTKMDDLETKDNTAPLGTINGIIKKLAAEYGVALLDNRAVMDQLPNRGAIWDGFHYNKPPDDQTANFTAGYLQYGYNQRNLTALQTLDVIRRTVMN